MDDPIVAEVRKTREAILEKFGGDLVKFFQYIREKENKKPEKPAQTSTKRTKNIMQA